MSPQVQTPARIAFASRLGYGSLTALTLMVYSEHLFWARPGPWIRAEELLPTFLAYAVAAYLFLTVVAHFRVRSLAALYLAGAVYGWFLEGVIVQTMYDDFPLNLSFTGLAWHALISVIIGWGVVPASLSRGSSGRTAALSIALGAGYGLWALWWWTIEPPPAALANFAAYTLVLALALMLAYGLAPRLPLQAFHPGKAERGVLFVLAGAYFVAVTVSTQPLSLIVLPPLALVVLVALSRNRRNETRQDQIQAALASPSPGAGQLLLLLLLPLTASTVYALADAIDARPPTGMLLYLITVPLGFGLLVWALASILRQPRAGQTDGGLAAPTSGFSDS